VNVRTGAEKRLVFLDPPPSTTTLARFSIHPDGKHILIFTSVAKWPFDSWMLEGFDGSLVCCNGEGDIGAFQELSE
jgi:hypothetical protein